MKKIHYAWVISIVCALIQICTNGLTISIMGTYLPFIQEQGYSGTAVSTLVTLRCMAAMAAMAIAPWLYRHVSLRRGLICCCASAAITLYLMAAAKSYLAYAVYAVLLGGTYGLGAMIPLSLLISNWFDSHRATALSICTLGTGISSMVMPPLVTGVAQGKSLAAAFHMMGSICLIVMLIAIFTVRNYPEDIGQSIYHIDTEAGTAAKGRNRVERTHYRLTKMQSFGMILAVVLLGSVSMAGCAHYAVLFTNCGYSKAQAALAISFMGIGNIFGKATYGPTVERIGSKKAAFVYLCLLTLGTVFCTLAPYGELFIYGGTLTMGFGFPPSTVGISIWADDFSTKEEFAGVLRNYQMSYVAGGMLFSSVPGWIYDHTGSYIGGYVMFVVQLIILTFFIMRTYRRTDVIDL